MRIKYLTKSRFKLALECITKLYYTGKREEYADKKSDNPFLEALADAGFQIGELAKYYFSNDPQKEKITIDTLDYDEALRRTEEMLNRSERVVIAEAAFKYQNLFVRTDILVRDGNTISIYEVKAKSFDSTKDKFLDKNGNKIDSDWIEHLYDLSFQRFVVTNALKEQGFNVTVNLMLVDKNAMASVEGLNQFIKIHKVDSKTNVIVKEGVTTKDFGAKILIAINMDDICARIQNEFSVPTDYIENISFEDFIWKCADIYESDKQEFTPLGSKCKKCQFNSENGNSVNLKSGFKECWGQKICINDLDKPLITELWGGLAGGRSLVGESIKKEKYLLYQLEEVDIASTSEKKKQYPGLNPQERRMEQINRVKRNDFSSYFDKEGIREEMKSWKFPLHMIDFETSMVALPFLKGIRPYEGIAFQFSHHTIDQHWNIRHQTQYLSFEVGKFPNFEFVRELKKALSNDDGTIFRYHNHENIYLNYIVKQLQSNPSAPLDKEDLIIFINSITQEKKLSRFGERNMVDLYDLVLRYYYSPITKGDISLKAILPALISESDYLKDKYGKAGVYGSGMQVHSLNFQDHIWIKPDKKFNPYKTLPKVFGEFEMDELDSIIKDLEDVADGGAALTAYNYLQFSEIPEQQREKIRDSLLRYCELDTMAMVMILEGWGCQSM